MRGLLPGRPSPAMVVAVVSLMVAVTATAYAAIPDAGGVIHACFNPSTGALRLTDSEDQVPRPCQPSETALNWNQRGLSDAQVGSKIALERPYAYVAPGGRGGPQLIDSDGIRGVRRVSRGLYCIRPEANFDKVAGVAQIALGSSAQRGFAFVRIPPTRCTAQELEVLTVRVTRGGFAATNQFKFVVDPTG